MLESRFNVNIFLKKRHFKIVADLADNYHSMPIATVGITNVWRTDTYSVPSSQHIFGG